MTRAVVVRVPVLLGDKLWGQELRALAVRENVLRDLETRLLRRHRRGRRGEREQRDEVAGQHYREINCAVSFTVPDPPQDPSSGFQELLIVS